MHGIGNLKTHTVMTTPGQYKLFNDPVHGFIHIPKGILVDLIDHPYVQRLRRIRQLGLGYLVYPTAEHSRFSHALGAMELCQRVLQNIRQKGTDISDEELESTLIAILLHDVGHGPLSHTLEHSLIDHFDHEMMSTKIMAALNDHFDGRLTTAIAIFENTYPRTFLHQLISSQLDMDRLDYLRRDSFFTGVSEGAIGVPRIIETLRVHNEQLVLEKKGIYSVENFILSRRFMYLQVYLHKTVLAADAHIRGILRRVKELYELGNPPSVPSPGLSYFLSHATAAEKGISDEMMVQYTSMDDHDLYACLKAWQHSDDALLRVLSQRFLTRKLLRTTFLDHPASDKMMDALESPTSSILKEWGIQPNQVDVAPTSYVLHRDMSTTEAYHHRGQDIMVLQENGEIEEFSKASDAQHIAALSQPIRRPYVVHPKEIQIDDFLS
jgi:HD superfamily phosphohydrolase